jgi:hypothetical protein
MLNSYPDSPTLVLSVQSRLWTIDYSFASLFDHCLHRQTRLPFTWLLAADKYNISLTREDPVYQIVLQFLLRRAKLNAAFMRVAIYNGEMGTKLRLHLQRRVRSRVRFRYTFGQKHRRITMRIDVVHI